jgi:hypothetical protein
MMIGKHGLMMVVLAAAACGGGKKGATTPTVEAADDVDETSAEAAPSEETSTLVPPEKMDEIKRMLDRKQRLVSRCLADAVDAQELPRNSRGKVTLEIVIATSGRPDTVRVLQSTLDSARLTDCVIGHVKSIQFPELPKMYPTSYTYAFEAM